MLWVASSLDITRAAGRGVWGLNVNIAYFGDDFFKDCFDVIIRRGHVVAGVFVAGPSEYFKGLKDMAQRLGIKVHHKDIDQKWLSDFVRKNKIDCIICAGYCKKIEFDFNAVSSVNIHPSLLPVGRGADAAAWISLLHQNAAGVTFHKISESLDEGDIIIQKRLNIDRLESWDMYMLKAKLAAKEMLTSLLDNFPQYYRKARRQGPGVEWPVLTASERVLSWVHSHQEMVTLIKGFGRWGVITAINKRYFLINNIEVSRFEHHLPVGEVITEDKFAFYIATKEGVAIVRNQDILREIHSDEAAKIGLPEFLH